MATDSPRMAEADAFKALDEPRFVTLPTRIIPPEPSEDIFRVSEVVHEADRDVESHSKRPAQKERRTIVRDWRKKGDGDEDEAVRRRRQVSADLSVHTAFINQQWLQLQQMLNNFLNMHFPTVQAQASLDFRNSYLLRLPHLNLTESPLLKAATAVVCTASIANRSKDAQMQNASHQQYATVMNLLRREMTRPRQTVPRWAMVFSIMLLTMFDDVSPFGNTPRTDWVTHYEGALAYLQAVGPSKFSLNQPETRQLIANLRTPALYIALARRKPCMFARADWSEHLLERGVLVPTSKRGLIRAFHIAILQIPAILERLEKAIKSPVDFDALDEICVEIEELIAHIRKTNAPREDLKTIHSDLVYLSEHERFDPLIEEHVFITTNTTFQSFFAPGAIMERLECAYVWMHELILDCALLRIYQSRPDLAMRDGLDVTADIHQDASALASNLCRFIYLISRESNSQAFCAVSEFFLLLAQNYFENAGVVRELGWCQGARLAVGLHLSRLEAKQPRTLCRLGDMAESVASVTAFRAPTQVQRCPFAD